ncbi:kinase-like domain, phloem protein 2-like protein, partial [Tanacetum coccineum]
MVLYKVRHIDIVQATEAYKETYRIGFDAHGMVYKAELDQFESESSSSTEEKNKREEAKKRITVAIKPISCREDEQGEQGFFEELEMCISYKHPNIASLLGFCDEGREMIFLYEHACNGSLDDYLGSNDDKTVSWEQNQIFTLMELFYLRFSGKLAYDLIYNGSDQGLAPMARQCCNDGTIKEMIDPKLLEETDEDGSTANKGPNQDSLDTFLKVACQCLGEAQTERPTMETVITELQKALNFQ